MTPYFVDGVFTDNEPAWHRAGIVVPDETLTIDRAFELVPTLAAQIERVPLLATAVEDTGDVTVLDIPNRYATARRMPDGTLNYIDVVSDRYEITQPQQTAAFAEAILASEGGSVVKTAGVIGERAETIWFLLGLGDFEVAGEPWARYLAACNSYDAKGGQKAWVTNTRIVCANTFNASLRGAQRVVSLRHTSTIHDRARDAARALNLSVDFDKALQRVGSTLTRRPFRTGDMKAFARDLIPYDPDAFKDGEATRKRHIANVDDARFDLAYLWENVPNLEGIRGSAWGAMQATIEWQQRYAYPDRVPTARAAAVLADNGINTRALELLAKV